MPTKKSEKSHLEKVHERLLKIAKEKPAEQNKTLEQPSVYKTIHSVTTYGAYEDPI